MSTIKIFHFRRKMHNSFDNRFLINEVSVRPGIPNRQNAIEILTKTVNAVIDYCADTLSKGIGITIPGFGYAFFENSFDKKEQKGYRELNFAFEEKFTGPLKLKVAIAQQLSTYVVDSMPFGDKHGPIHRLNFTVIGQQAGYNYQDCMEGFQLFMLELERFIRAGYDGSVDFKFGKLHIKNYETKFVYDQKFIQQLKESKVFETLKTSQVLTGGKTFRPSDHFNQEQIVLK